ncbi:hypothetical protein [Streptomyces sp. HUAS ZL42]|uniref:hypothetical protein n=1 Tax=Streptomyces sp. HUAS ZL42 TaxID=3231715 RepID=UPI00345ED377
MKYVDLDGEVGGPAGVIDPRPYLERLPLLAEQLPPGARAFATAPGHYDFSGKRCVKDLKPQAVRRSGDDEIEIRFGHNCRQHDEDLLIRYTGISRFQVDVLDVCDVAALGDVILDEVLPHAEGCTHEIACRPGTLVVACRDLRAEWVVADCPELGR